MNGPAAPAAADYLTVLHAPGYRLTKSFRGPALKPRPVGHPTQFTPFCVALVGFADLASYLEELRDQPSCIIVRGAPNVATKQIFRRKASNHTDGTGNLDHAPRRWVWLDLDSVEVETAADWRDSPGQAVRDTIEQHLPPPFHNRSVHWQWSSSQGTKSGLRLHLAFWLDRAVSDAELKAWLADAPVDRAMFDSIQAHYTAAPVFTGGAIDPVPQRSGVIHGETDTVVVPSIDLTRPLRGARPTSQRPSEGPGEAKATGRGFKGRLADIGDHAGGHGLHNAVMSAVAAAYTERGAELDQVWLAETLRERIAEAEWRRSPGEVAQRTKREIREAIQWVSAKEAKRAGVGELEGQETLTLAEAEKAIGEALDVFIDRSTAHNAEVKRRAGLRSAGRELIAEIDDTWTDHVAERMSGDWLADLATAADFKRDAKRAKAEARKVLAERLLRDELPEAGALRLLWNAETPKSLLNLLNRETVQPTPAAGLLRVTPGAAKSTIGRAKVAAWALAPGQDKTAVFAVPTHALAEEFMPAMRADHPRVAVEIWRGQTAANPAGGTMCSNLPLRKLALEAGRLVSDACAVCPVRKGCAYQEQTLKRAKVWILTHAMLMHPRPRAMGEVAFLIVDEGVDPYADWGYPADVFDHPTDDVRLRELRAQARAAFAAVPLVGGRWPTPVRDFDPALAAEAFALEPKPERVDLRVDPAKVEEILKAEAGSNRRLRKIWRALKGDGTQLRAVERGGVRYVEGTRSMKIVASWRLPTVVLDGTATVRLARVLWPQIELTLDIAVEAPHQELIRVTGREFGKNWQHPTGSSEEDDHRRLNNIEKLRRVIEHQASLAWPETVGFVGHKKTLELLREGRLPENLEMANFGALRGLNSMATCATLLVCGRPRPGDAELEHLASVLDGEGAAETRAAVSWSIVQAELLQAVARARGIRRTGATPVRVYLLNQEPLPGVTGAVSWEDFQPDTWELMRTRGVEPEDRSARGVWVLVHAVLADVFSSSTAARLHNARGALSRVRPPIERVHIGERTHERWEHARCRPPGGRYAVAVHIDPERLRRSGLATKLLPPSRAAAAGSMTDPQSSRAEHHHEIRQSVQIVAPPPSLADLEAPEQRTAAGSISTKQMAKIAAVAPENPTVMEAQPMRTSGIAAGFTTLDTTGPPEWNAMAGERR